MWQSFPQISGFAPPSCVHFTPPSLQSPAPHLPDYSHLPSLFPSPHPNPLFTPSSRTPSSAYHHSPPPLLHATAVCHCDPEPTNLQAHESVFTPLHSVGTRGTRRGLSATCAQSPPPILTTYFGCFRNRFSS